jgi:hypothetical protein
MSYERKTFDIEISDGLRKVLENIKNQSNIAQMLLKRRHNKEDLVDDPVNYISISSQDSSRISYLTSERIEQLGDCDLWSSSKRFHIKPGGFISKVFKNINPKDVEIFSNVFRAESNKPSFEFKVVSGPDIKKYYHHSKHVSDYGSLGVSCMRYDRCQKYFQIYTQNPNTISMLVMLNDSDEVLGRSLLWQFDGNKLMDRIYTINDEHLQFYFKKWADENDFLNRRQQNWYNSIQFQKSGITHEVKLQVQLENFDFDYYPYMDTFRFLNTETGVLSNFLPEGTDFVTLCGSEGDTNSYNYLGFDKIDGVFRHRSELVYLDYLKISTSSNNCYWSEVNDCYILCQHATWNDHLSDYLFDSDYESNNNQFRITGLLHRLTQRVTQ